MENRYRDVILLIRAAIKKEKVDLPVDFDFDNILKIALEQRLLAVIVFNGAMLAGFKRSSKEMGFLINIVSDRLLMRATQMKAYEELVSSFEQSDISYMPIKGSFIKDFYPNPQMRLMEDIDLMIREDEYPRIKKVMTTLGYKESPYADNHFVWSKGIVSMELHRMLLGSQDYYNKIYYSKRDEWKYAIKCEGSSRYEMRPEDHYVFLLVHFAKHYRHGSISLKSVIDFYVFKNTFPNMDMEYLEGVLKRLSLLDFSNTVDRLLDVWFEGKESDDVIDSMTDVIFRTGIYDGDGSYCAATILSFSKNNEIQKNSRLKWIIKTIFPSAKSLEVAFPVLKKHKIMLPFCWVAKWIDVILDRPERIKAKLITARDIAGNSELITNYKKRLEEVGLEFIMPTKDDLE